VAGIVAAAAPGVVLMPLRVLNSDGTGTAFNVTRAIYLAIDGGAQVINLSLGLNSRVDAMEIAIGEAKDAGILVVASAGNRGIEDPNHFPAGLSDVMAIAATDAFDRKASFSNYGRHISVSAPGEEIMSTYWNGGYAVWSGTSMAAPFVSGAGALRLAMESVDPKHLQRLIEATSFKIDTAPYDLGKGRVDLLALTQARRPDRDVPDSRAMRLSD
jgi:thermitase